MGITFNPFDFQGIPFIQADPTTRAIGSAATAATGVALGLPEMGISEWLLGQRGAELPTNQPAPTQTDPYAPPTIPTTATYDAQAAKDAQDKVSAQASYQDQIDSLQGLLGNVRPQYDTGLRNLQDQRATALQGYDEQKTQNTQARQTGTEQVDRYAGNNMTQLQRLLQGANAGNSSVGRDLIPYLISKSAGQRRQSVFNTAGENDINIERAINNTNKEFDTQEGTFRSNLWSKESQLQDQIAAAQSQKAAVNGSGYEAARAAGADARAQSAARNAEISALFSKYTPMTRTPELKTYQQDPAQLQTQGQGLPSESSYYLSQLLGKGRKKELV